MFKKAWALRARTALRESDRRRLRKDVEASFPSLRQQDLDLLLSKSAAVEQLRLTTAAGSQVTLYVSNGEPVVYQFDGDEALVPTCHLMLRCPTALPPVLTHAAVFRYVQNGADLMLPGVVFPAGGVEALGEFARGQLRCLWVVGYATPVAVGRMAVSSAELKAMTTATKRLRGKCLLVQHVYGDQLWQSGPKVALPLGDATPYTADASIEYDSDEYESGSDDGDNALDQGTAVAAVLASPANPVADTLAADVGAMATTDASNTPANSLSADEPTPDEVLHAAFMLALRRQLKDKDLPLLASTFYANCILPCKPRGHDVDIKKSSFKKLGKFLESYETKGLIKTSEVKGVLSITAVNRQHEMYSSFRPTKWEAEPSEDNTASSSSSSAAPSTTAAASATGKANEPYIMELYKVSSSFASIMTEQGKSRDVYYTLSELRAIINEYVNKHNLANPTNPRMVVLDPLLSDTLVRKDERSSTPELARDVLANEFAAKQTAYYRVTPPDGSEPALKRGNIKPIQIVVEQRGGRKSVTLITNLETFAIDPDAFAKTLQKKLASSTSVTPLPGKNATGMCVLVQGNMAQEVTDMLTTQMAVPKKFVEANVKTK